MACCSSPASQRSVLLYSHPPVAQLCDPPLTSIFMSGLWLSYPSVCAEASIPSNSGWKNIPVMGLNLKEGEESYDGKEVVKGGQISQKRKHVYNTPEDSIFPSLGRRNLSYF